MSTSQLVSRAAETHVLAFLADGEAELVFIDHHGGSAELKAQRNLNHLGRLERVGNQQLAGFVPADDVDFLAAQFIDDVADPRTTYPHAGSDRVDLVVRAGHRNLGAVARLTSHRANFDDAFGDLGDFNFKQATDELRGRTREHNFDLAAGVTHVEDVAADAFAGLMLLAGDLLTAGHETLGAADLNDQRAAFITLRQAGGKLANPVDKLIKDRGPLVFTESLDHDLLGGLGGDAAEVFKLDGLLTAPDLDLAGEAVDFAGEILGVLRVEMLTGGGNHGLLEVFIEQLFLHVAFAGDGIDQS